MRIVLAFLAATVCVSSAYADRSRAEQLAREARDQDDPAKYVACGQEYLAVYNSVPTASDIDETLYNAAVCFEDGKAVAAALQAGALLRKYAPRSKLGPRILARIGRLQARIGSLAEAAASHEEYARKYAGERDAFSALSDATYFRAAIGDDAKQVDDVQFLIRTFGQKRATEAASAHLSLVPVMERRGRDAVIEHLRDYLRVFGSSGGTDRAIAVRAKLGGVLWQKACPVAGTDGLCVKDQRVDAKPGTTCGGKSFLKLTVVARDAQLARQARAMLATARALYERSSPQDPAAQHAVALARLALADGELESYLAVQFPTGLDFDPKRERARTASLERFTAFVEKKQKLGASARQSYEAIVMLKEPTAAVAAAERMGQLAQSFARQLSNAEFARDKIAAFCDKLVEVAVPFATQAETAFEICAQKASELGILDDHARRCFSERPRYALPEQFAQPTTGPIPFSVEPAVRSRKQDPRPLADALAAFAAAEHRGWTPALCKQVAGKLVNVTAHYMAGLAFHRCGLAAEARAQYELVRGSHAAARSNLGELEWRAGKRDAAKQTWRAALAIDGKLYAARANLGAAMLVELGARRDAKLESAARFELASALAVSDDPAARVLMATLVERDPKQQGVARYFVAEALRVTPARAVAHVAAGVQAARRGAWPHALASFKEAVRLDPAASDAHERLGLALLRIARFTEASAQLAAAAPGYDVHVARGVALRGLGNLAEAEAAYAKAIAIDAARPDAHVNTGLVLERKARSGAPAAAKATLARALEAYRRGGAKQRAAELEAELKN